ncbi:hypothetical protein HELRODRAFT_161538 [Helobdella robusta]|uniref:Uncharacterized protein n=1 Tax=Helobdella robusta TaxID=6412 RepID=T1ERL6_HELRO|nr:hypothetical protein HELRODRAFT_161538 [Helobdella robusta]ESO02286.1 hypothetical protein HELRODRAFT_161538 [Helobdella robusta]
MKNDVAFGFNMVGKKGKIPFGSSKLFEIVYRSVKKCFNWRGHEKRCGVSSGKMVDCPCKARLHSLIFPHGFHVNWTVILHGQPTWGLYVSPPVTYIGPIFHCSLGCVTCCILSKK